MARAKQNLRVQAMPGKDEDGREGPLESRQRQATITNGDRATSSLGHMPEASWEFDQSVTAVFDDMLARSIPQIGAMRESVFQVAAHLMQPETHVVDLGCALGTSMVPLIERFGEANRYLGIEASAPMTAACRTRLRSFIDSGLVEIRNDDLQNGYPDVQASVTLCVLTLMFLPIEIRLRILANAFQHTCSGGGLIVVEKILGSDLRIDALLAELYYRHKETMGYTPEEIDRKRLALEGVLVPVTAGWNEEMLMRSGFRHVECFWRATNFCGWIAIKS